MKIAIGTIEHIRQLAILRQDGGLSAVENVELFDSIDCLNQDELSELYAVAYVGKVGNIGLFGKAVDEARGHGDGTTEYLFGFGNLGTYLATGTALLNLK